MRIHPRRTELGLLVVAWLIGVVCYATVDLATLGRLPVNYVALLVGSAVVLLAGHLVIRRLAPHADPVLFPVAAMLNLLGLVMIHRLDVADQLRAEANDNKVPSADALAQATWVLVALGLFTLVLFLVTDHRKLQRYTFTSLVAGVALLLLPLLPIIGTSINGARLWIRLGPLSFQPSELAKVALTIFFAGYLVRKRETLATVRRKVLGLGIPRGRDFGPLLVAWLAGDPGVPARPGHGADVLRRLRDPALRGNAAAQLADHRRSPVRAGGRPGVPGLRSRAVAGQDLAGPLGLRQR